MEHKERKSRRKRLKNWFTKKPKGQDPFHLSQVSSDGDDDSIRVAEDNSCNLSDEIRIFVATWNVAGRSPVGSLAVDLDDWLNLKEAADIYVLGFQEIVPLKTRTILGAEDSTQATNWNKLIGKTLNSNCVSLWMAPTLKTPTRDHSKTPVAERDDYGCYKLVASKKMVGVFISVWMKKDLVKKYCISSVKVCSVACGIMGYLGNKGSVSVSMSIEGTSFCFIAAHLASGEKNGDEIQRNYQVSEIFRRTCFPRARDDDDNLHPLTILGHDQIFWLGDLNYRLYLEDNLARMLINTKDWKSLQAFDQLRKEQSHGGVFEGWREGDIGFAPTYKYSTFNCNRYSGGIHAKSGEKQRTPAWCDRILWYGKGVKQLSYFRSESKFSDHRPVSALFSTKIEVLNSATPVIVTLPKILPALLPQNDYQLGRSTDEKDVSGHEGRTRPTLLSLLVQEIKPSSSSLALDKDAAVTNNINTLSL